MKRLSSALLVTALFAASMEANPRRINPNTYIEHVRFLASDDLEGRGNGGRGLESAAEYLAARFREAGLEPAATGKQISEIAKEMGLSPSTVSTYRTRILRKLGLTSNAALVHYAVRHQLVG
jgi:DNA-binding NarL/FixJ family response regulator